MNPAATLASSAHELQRVFVSLRTEGNADHFESAAVAQRAVENAAAALRSVNACCRDGTNPFASVLSACTCILPVFQSEAELLCSLQRCISLDSDGNSGHEEVPFPEQLIQALLTLAFQLEMACSHLETCHHSGVGISPADSAAMLCLHRHQAKVIVGLFGLDARSPSPLLRSNSADQLTKNLTGFSEEKNGNVRREVSLAMRQVWWRSAIMRAEGMLAVLCGRTPLGSLALVGSGAAVCSAPVLEKGNVASLDVFFGGVTDGESAGETSGVELESRDLQRVVLETLRRFENTLRCGAVARDGSLTHVRQSVDLYAIRFVMLFIDAVSAASRNRNAAGIPPASGNSSSGGGVPRTVQTSPSHTRGGNLVDATDQVDFMGEVASFAEVLLLPTMQKFSFTAKDAAERASFAAFRRLVVTYQDILNRIVERQHGAPVVSEQNYQKTMGVFSLYNQLVEDTDRATGVSTSSVGTDSCTVTRGEGHPTAFSDSTCISPQMLSADDVQRTLRSLKAHHESERSTLFSEVSKVEGEVVSVGNSVLREQLKNEKLRALVAELERVQSEVQPNADLLDFLRECLPKL